MRSSKYRGKQNQYTGSRETRGRQWQRKWKKPWRRKRKQAFGKTEFDPVSECEGCPLEWQEDLGETDDDFFWTPEFEMPELPVGRQQFLFYRWKRETKFKRIIRKLKRWTYKRLSGMRLSGMRSAGKPIQAAGAGAGAVSRIRSYF